MKALLVVMLVTASHAYGQVLLPQGIGFIQLGARQYSPETQAYSSSGAKEPIGSPYTRTLDGAALKDGRAGAQLRELATEIDRLDPQRGTDAALLNDLALGTVGVEAEAKVRAQFLAAAFGLTPRLTLFAAVPVIEAETYADVVTAGDNNALALKGRLGGYAYAALQDGLERAALLSADDVRASLDDAGYAPLGAWDKRGFGDVRFGAKTAFSRRLAYGLGTSVALTSTVTAPTGYVERPELLQDVSLGTGYWSLGADAAPQLAWLGRVRAGAPVAYQHNFATHAEKRVPDGEGGFPDESRQTRVALDPGDDTDVALEIGGGTGVVDVSARQGVRRHYADRYAGGLDGDYAALAEGSDRTHEYRELALKLDTTPLYLKKRAPAPVVLTLSAFDTLGGRNCRDERYVQASVATFFSAGGRR